MKLSRLHLLVSMTMMTGIMFAGMRFTLLLDAVHQNAPKVQIGILGALVSLFPTLLSLRMGRRIDLHGPRGPMLTACVTLIACALAGFIDDHMAVLFGMAIFMGIANNAWTIAHQQMVGAFSRPGELAAGYSLSALGYSTIAFLAPVLSGLSIEHLGFSHTYAWQALTPLVPLAVIGTGRMALPGGSHAPGKPVPARGLREVFDLLKSPLLREIYIIGALFEASWTLFSFLTPIYGTQLGLSSSTIGMITGSISVSTLGVRLFLPMLVRRVAPWRLLIAALGILGLGYLAFSLSHTVTMLVACALVLGLGQAMGAPVINALLYELAPAGRAGEAVGLRSTLNNGSQTVLPLLSGALGAALGIAPAFWLLSGAILAGAVKVRRRWHLKLHARAE